ncbi:ATP-binding protein [Sodalis sp. dw_96]|uniref:sensor histidine kinase n=1 Tax=Sodalis sp. dw_96 TaxID=2719794 RepID=UPI001BD62B17|nr:ATP-binding protein [Sodalis sp. dw_96]
MRGATLKKPVPLFILGILFTLFWLMPKASGAVQLLPHEINRLDRAELIVGTIRQPQQPPLQPGIQVSLPDNWRIRDPQFSGIVWYRLHFNLARPPEWPLGLYLPHLSVAGEIWLNGSLLNPGVRFGSPGGKQVRAMNDRPVFIVLPAGLFRPGDNVLAVRLLGDSSVRSGLSAITLGPAMRLHRIYFQRYLLQVVTPYVLLILVAGSLCFLLAYTWQQRRLFIIQFALVVSVATLLSYILDMRLSLGAQQALRTITTTIMYWALCVAGYRLADIRLRGFLPLLHGLTAVTLAFVLVVLLLGEATDRIWLVTWPHVLIRLVPIGLLIFRGWQSRGVKFIALGLTALFWNATVAQSYFIIMDWLPWDSCRLSIAGALPFCLVMIFYFAERFIASREGSRREQRAAIIAERMRILQDMHDGMGAQLITALRLARREDADREDLARHIEESLQDLRLIIDSLDMTEHDLLPLLGNLRFRLEPRLQALGIRLAWDVSPIPPLAYLTPESALSVLRIVQEAVNNALQHAQPTLITISVQPRDNTVIIRVADNGHGVIPEDRRPGSRGLNGMQTRADKLGVRLFIRGGSQGTEVALFLPLLAQGLSRQK